MTELRGFKVVTTLVVELNKLESDNGAKCNTFYSNSKKETIINESAIDAVFKSICVTIMSNIQKSLGNGLDWITDSVIDRNINISKYIVLVGSSYIKLYKELDHPK